MKKIFLFAFAFMFLISGVQAKDYSIKFNGEKYNLLYSAKNKDFGGYINEYFKRNETYNTWSEMIAVHHFPNAYSPIDRIKDFKNYLGSMNVPSALTFDDKKNTAMIDFIMISGNKMPIVMEFNIFKYEKSKKCGSIAIQYAKRYSAVTTMQIEQIKADFEKNRKILIKKVKKLEIPTVIDDDIDKCISAVELKAETDEEIKKEKEAIAAKEAAEKEAAENAAEKEAVDKDIAKKDAEEIAIKEEENNNDANISVEAITEQTAEQNVTTTKELSTEETSKEDAIEINEAKKQEEVITDNNKDNNIKETKEVKKEEVVKAASAPVPVAGNKEENVNTINEKQVTKKNKKNKKVKDVSYEVANDKSNFIAQPRTKKELKAEIKQNKLKQKQAARDEKYNANLEKKNSINAEKQAKKQAKIDKKNKIKAEKMAKKPYEISNSNNELVAKKRTKKDLKAQNKKLKKQAKERVKEAKKKLSE